MNKNHVVIVAPVHIQVSEEWMDQIDKQECDVIIVDDSNGKVNLPERWERLDYKAQENLLGTYFYERFTRFHKSSSCKSIGLYYAYLKGYENVIVLDSDCVVPDNFIRDHLIALHRKGYTQWVNPLDKIGWYSRGYPYSKRDKEVKLNMGMWYKNLDLYGKDQLEKRAPELSLVTGVNVAPGILPLSGMNLMIKRELIPAMLFLPNFRYGDNKFGRHDDIFGGYILQKIMQMKGDAVTYGIPFVKHETIVRPSEDAAEEEAMIKYEDAFYEEVDTIFSVMKEFSQKGTSTYWGYFAFFADLFSTSSNPLFKDLVDPLKLWKDIFEIHEGEHLLTPSKEND